MASTSFHEGKLRTFAQIASIIVRQWHTINDPGIAYNMLTEGLRKLHDNAKSFRGQGKFKGHAHWSREALEILSAAENNLSIARASLSHEHVVPVKAVIEKLVSLGESATPEACAAVVLNYSLVAIITRQENDRLRQSDIANKLPEGWEQHDIWARYKAAGLDTDITST